MTPLGAGIVTVEKQKYLVYLSMVVVVVVVNGSLSLMIVIGGGGGEGSYPSHQVCGRDGEQQIAQDRGSGKNK